MKTDKKKLMRKLIAIGLMAAMLTANTVTYGSDLMLPSVTAEALSISEEGATVIDISERELTYGRIYVSIDEDGTYILKGSNYREDGDSYVTTKITVSGGIEANIILDGVEIRNSSFLPSGDFNENHPIQVNDNCIVNIYIKSDSVLTCSVDGEQGCIEGSDNSTINFMESENNAKLTTEIIYAPNVNFKGANVVGQPKETSTAVTMTDGYCGYANEAAVLGSDDVITGGYCALDASSNPTDGNGNNVYRSTLSDLPANAKVVSYNGKTYNYSYTDADGQFITYLPDLSASGLVVFFENEVYLYKTENITSAETDGITSYDFSNPTKLSSAINLNKAYDGNGDGDFNIVVDETKVDEITNLTINSVTPVEANVGTYTTTVNIGFTHGGQNYTTDIEVPVEITAKELATTITAKDKVYDKSSEVDTEVIFEGLVGSETLTADVDYTVTAEFEDENVGTDKTVNVTVTLNDTDIAKNYRIASTNIVTADITAAPLTITGVTVENKVFDGTKTATVTAVEFDGVMEGDVVDYTATAEFTDENASADKEVTVTVKLDDTTENYKLENNTFVTKANITSPAVTTPSYTGRPSWVTTPAATTTTTTTTTITTPADDKDEVIDDTVVDDDTDTTKPADGNEPQIKGENGKTGWDAIADEITNADDGDRIVVDMNGATEVPEDIFEQIQGQEIDLVIELDNGFTWTINGQDVTDPATVDLGVNEGSEIPVKVINEVTGESKYITITLNHEGDFGFTAILTVDMGEENEGLYANLYFYTGDEAEFICADKISSKGKADLTFDHASEYIVVIDETNHGKRVEESTDSETDAIVSEEEDDANPGTGVVAGFAGVLASAIAVMLTKKRKK